MGDIWRERQPCGAVFGVEARPFDEEDTRVLFEVLFDIRTLLAQLVEYVIGGDEDGGEEPEETDEPRVLGALRGAVRAYGASLPRVARAVGTTCCRA
jgi:hypothetical protein